MRLDDLALEVLLQIVRTAHRPEAQGVVHLGRTQTLEVCAQMHELENVARLERGGIRRRTQQKRSDQATLSEHITREALVGFGIAAGMTGDLAAQGVVIVVEGEMSSIAHERAATVVRNDLQPEARQLERADDLRTQETANVRAVGVGEVLIQAAAHRGTTDVVVALQYEDVQPCACEIARGDEAVVAGSHDDHVAHRVRPRAVAPSRHEARYAGCLREPASERSVVSTATSNAASVSLRQLSS